ncbi:plastid lipid-associated PAP/fibrillin family protein [Nitzschia inconspicua]|uniref:Plastid lipid-associated PAP/fibrillin family protein n=1 Tax=Nitzschia inconspicua TaxID=303405 RepID=A0A9K3LYX7_9STRA|nr:plastid lipid-associated PAP/fibrillin family protein [Nitzschia inconspicua]
MKLFTCLLLGGSFDWKQPFQLIRDPSAASNLLVDVDTTALKNDIIVELLETAQSVGQVGSIATEEDRLKVEMLAQSLIPLSDSKQPARYPLEGVHKLVYSAAPGASSGKIGPFVGKVSQFFEDDEIFYNRVEFGPLSIALRAKREVKNNDTIKVSFLETAFSLFGKTLKKSQAGGGGVWKVKFVGTYRDGDGKEKLVRIMETPSLFVLEHSLS